MSVSLPILSRIPPDYPPTNNVVVLGVSKCVAFGQTRIGWWLNRTLSLTERANLQMLFSTEVYETPVDGSSKAGIPLKHPRWSFDGVPVVRGVTGTTCNGLVQYGQFVTADVGPWVVLRWATFAQPPYLQRKWLSPPLLVADIPLQTNRLTRPADLCN